MALIHPAMRTWRSSSSGLGELDQLPLRSFMGEAVVAAPGRPVVEEFGPELMMGEAAELEVRFSSDPVER